MSEHDIPWWTPQVGQNEYANLRDVLESNYLNDGDVTTQFEQEIAKLVGATYAVGVTNGTSALFLSLAALGIGHGDEVVVPDLTFIATANAVTLTGATPVLVDIDPATFNIDADKIEAAVTNRTRAILPVSLYGQCSDMDTINAIALRHNLTVIEDAAQAFGARLGRHEVGTMGDAAAFSFFPTKNLGGYGDGGAVVLDSEDRASLVRALRSHGRGAKAYYSSYVGYNARLDALQAALLRVKLAHVDEANSCRRDLAKQYHGLIQGESRQLR